MNVQTMIEAAFEEELSGPFSPRHYGREDGATKEYRRGHRERKLTNHHESEGGVPRNGPKRSFQRPTSWCSPAFRQTAH